VRSAGGVANGVCISQVDLEAKRQSPRSQSACGRLGQAGLVKVDQEQPEARRRKTQSVARPMPGPRR